MKSCSTCAPLCLGHVAGGPLFFCFFFKDAADLKGDEPRGTDRRAVEMRKLAVEVVGGSGGGEWTYSEGNWAVIEREGLKKMLIAFTST